MKRIVLSVLSMAWLSAGSVAWAGDTGPVTFERYTENIQGELQADCGAFQILADYKIIWEIKYVNGVMVANHLRFDPAKFYNSTDPAIYVMSGPGEQQNNNHIDLATGEVRATMHFKVIVPGGPLYMETGLFVFKIGTGTGAYSTGLNDYVNGSFATLCDYLSAPHTTKK
jgi:hypothetical protein